MTPRVAAPTRPRAAFALLAIAVAAGGLAVLVYRGDADQRDREAVSAIVSDMESKLRARVEGAYPAELAHPGDALAQEKLRADLDRLAHLDRLRILPGDVEVRGGAATVDYGIVSSRRLGDPPPPGGGRFVFERGSQGWHLAANRFFAEAPQRGGSRRRHEHSHAGLSGRLAAIAALALLAGAFLLVQPVVRRAGRARTTPRSRRR